MEKNSVKEKKLTLKSLTEKESPKIRSLFEKKSPPREIVANKLSKNPIEGSKLEKYSPEGNQIKKGPPNFPKGNETNDLNEPKLKKKLPLEQGLRS